MTSSRTFVTRSAGVWEDLYVTCDVSAVSIAVMSVDLGSEWMKMAIVKPGVPMEIVLNK